MPEFGALAVEFIGGLGGEAAAGGVAAGAGEAALGAGSSIAGEVAFDAGATAVGAGAADVGFAGVTDLGAAGVGGAGAATMGGGAGLDSASATAANAEGAYPSSVTQPSTWDTLTQLFSGKGGAGSLSQLFGKGGAGLGLIQAVSGLYGLSESSKLKKLATQPNKAGEQAVTRSLASQGYQGSGNMMAALNQYGINGSLQASQAGQGPLMGQLSSLGLLTSGLPALAGWGGTPTTGTGGT